MCTLYGNQGSVVSPSDPHESVFPIIIQSYPTTSRVDIYAIKRNEYPYYGRGTQTTIDYLKGLYDSPYVKGYLGRVTLMIARKSSS